MLSAADKAQMAANSVELIGGTGETIVRKRLDTTLPPASYDGDYGEVEVKAEETYLELTLTGKLLEATEKLLAADFGGQVEADAVVHVGIDDDVAAGDFLVIREQWYEVGTVRESELKSFRACAVRKTSAREGETGPAPQVIDGGTPDSEYLGTPIDGGTP